jgi:protein-disulfide isomerase
MLLGGPTTGTAGEGPAGEPQAPRPGRVVVDVDGSPSVGPATAAVTIVEFADFQCPYCAQGMHALRRLQVQYPTQVRLVFKHFPLRSHEDSPLAHEAAAIAAEQGKFWEMYRALMADQASLGRDALVERARTIGLDLDAFVRDLDTRRLRGVVRRDVVQGRGLNVVATPTYFINGRRVVGARPLAQFKDLVEQELRAVPARPGTGG